MVLIRPPSRYMRNPLLRLEAARMANTYSHASFNHSAIR
jgi:hypothetical protein